MPRTTDRARALTLAQDDNAGAARDLRRARRHLPVVFAIAMLATALLSATASAAGEKAPKVTKQPVSQTIEEGQSATFLAEASGVPTPTVQWELSTNGGGTWSAVLGATSDQLAVADATVLENGDEYRATFKNNLGEAMSKVATLTVQKLPSVTKQPVSTTVEEGQNAVFEATASGFPAPTVTWQSSSDGGATWATVGGATSDQLTIADAKTTSSGREYRAIFKNTAGSATSNAATLTVQKVPSVTKQPASTTVDEGESAVFEASASGFPTPTVKWEISTNGGGSWSAVEGATAVKLTVTSTRISEDGDEYRAVFQNAAGSATSQAATLSVHAPPVVTQQPSSTTVQVGENATFEATVSGYPAPTVQWEVSTNGGSKWSALTGATADQLTVENPQVSESGNEYRATFSNVAGKATSTPAILTVATNHYAAVDWGDGTYGQLGDGLNLGSDVPVQVSSLKFVTSVAAGAHHSLALLANGTVMAWGAGGYGQLGDGYMAMSNVPVEVEGLTGVKAIAAGANHSLALLKNGTVMAWGDDESGQLGIGRTSEEGVAVPTAVKGLTNVEAISAGAEFSLALLKDGTVMAWGNNEEGQLGIGSTQASDVPVAVHGLSHVTAIAGGGDFALALRDDGTVEGWGSDESGQLANSEVEESISEVPVPVEQLSGVTAIAAGAQHGLALLGSGTVMAWGEDSYGELGDGVTTASQETPVAVSGLSGVTAISAGDQDSVALLGSGSVMAWGNNHYGELGDGETGGISDLPVNVVGLAKVASVSAGRLHVLAFGEPIPTVTSVSPDTGPSSGGTTVTLTGVNFTGATSVKFNTTEATKFTVNSATSITATAPPGTGTVYVTVTTPTGTSPTLPADRYTYVSPPTVEQLSAKSGPAGGGTSVTITGTGFSTATEVSFGETSAAKFTINSATSITVLSPAATAGTVDVIVTNPGGSSVPTSKDHFKYIPSVEAVTPKTGSTLGGTSVTVTGTGFALGSSATTFDFGKAKATSIECTSSTSCTMVAPAQAAGTVNVTAKVNNVKSPIAPGDEFTYS